MNLNVGHMSTNITGEAASRSTESQDSPWVEPLRWRERAESEARDERRVAAGDCDD